MKAKEKSKKSTTQLYGETIIELGKLTFGGVVLGAILKTDTSNALLIFGGIILCIILIALGINMVNNKNNK